MEGGGTYFDCSIKSSISDLMARVLLASPGLMEYCTSLGGTRVDFEVLAYSTSWSPSRERSSVPVEEKGERIAFGMWTSIRSGWHCRTLVSEMINT